MAFSSPAVGSLTFTSPTHQHEVSCNDHHYDDAGGGCGGGDGAGGGGGAVAGDDGCAGDGGGYVGVILDSVQCISGNLSIVQALGSIDFAEEASSHSFLTLLTDFGNIEPFKSRPGM